MINAQHYFDQPIKTDFRTYDNIWVTATGQGDDHTTGCLLDYPYFKQQYKMIAMDLIRQQESDADPNSMQKFNFTGNLDFH